MSRIVEKTMGFSQVVLICEYDGDIYETLGFKNELRQVADIPRYRLFAGRVGRCLFMVSQGKGITDPKKVIISCFGPDEETVNKAIDIFLGRTGIKEKDVPEKELQLLSETAKKMADSGVVPEWME